MNKTLVFIAFTCIIIAGILASAVIILFRPEVYSQFANQLITLLGIASVGAGTFYGLGKVNEKQEHISEETKTIRTQTNGTLSELLRRNHELRDENERLRAERDSHV